jgi:hypothetical protein
MIIAKNAITKVSFALAQKSGALHTDPAFQASSPKLSSPAGNGRAFFGPFHFMGDSRGGNAALQAAQAADQQRP